MTIAISNRRQSLMTERIARFGRITSKNQLTIPKDFMERLNLGREVEIILEDNHLIIRKMQRIENSFDDYSDMVLESILKEQAFTSSEELLQEFRLRMSLLPIAAEHFLTDIRAQVKKDTRTSEQLDKELFGED